MIEVFVQFFNFFIYFVDGRMFGNFPPYHHYTLLLMQFLLGHPPQIEQFH